MGHNWLTMHGPLRLRAVRMDALVSVRQYDGVTAHLVLRDTYGHHLELDPRILTDNLLLWHELDTGVRRSLEKGTLLQGEDVLRRLGEKIDGETVRAVLRVSGLS